MNKKPQAPETLLEAVQYFADPDAALEFVAKLRWPNGAHCPQCASEEVTFLATRRIWKCRSCKKQFSAKVGTIFEDSAIPLQKWLPALWMIANCKNGISSYELARALGVTQKSAWFMLHRIRLAMQTKTFTKFGGEVEVDESYIGGKARNMHASKKARLNMRNGRSLAGKVAVMGLLNRHGHGGKKHSTVRAVVLKGLRSRELQGNVRKNVEAGATVYSDFFSSYDGLQADYVHEVINHAEEYVRDNVHTNGIENFWSLLKRAIRGTYVSVEPFHLFRYLDEEAFRFNERGGTDRTRFEQTAGGIIGKRLTYAGLTGKLEPQT